MDTAGMLMEKGIPFTQIINEAFYEKTYLQNRLLGKCLMDSVLSEDGAIITCMLPRSVMEEWGAANSDLEGIVSQMLLTKGTKASIFASENSDGSWKFSLRSGSDVDVSAVAAAFGGGGHIRAAGCTVKANAEAACRKMHYMIREQIHV
jgi:phosphoesterase RecJ-like protein